MKNIHVLPTDKPSRLSILNSGKLNFGAEIMSSSNSKPQHIYITSDEEIKEGNWFIMSGFILRKCDYVDNYMIIDTTQGKHFFSVCKKIILTTDPSLVPDVQKIDDEFLEWFVKNPSCESVDLDTFSMGDKVLYNVVFPKEEPKQETLEKYHGNTVEYWKQNAEENYLTTPISVLKYITVLEEQAEQLREFKKKGGDKC
jgi:hypothetical protein